MVKTFFHRLQKRSTCKAGASFLEATPRFELGVELLQSSALPLGYVAVWITGARFAPVIFCMEQVTRLELATSTLARWRSTR